MSSHNTKEELSTFYSNIINEIKGNTNKNNEYLYVFFDSGENSYGRVLIRGVINKAKWELFKKLKNKYGDAVASIDGNLKGDPEISANELYNCIKVYEKKSIIIKLVETDKILEIEPQLYLLEYLTFQMECIYETASDKIILDIPKIKVWNAPKSSESEKESWNCIASAQLLMDESFYDYIEDKIVYNELFDIDIKEVFGYDELFIDDKKCETFGEFWDLITLTTATDIISKGQTFFPSRYTNYKSHELLKIFSKYEKF